MILIQEDDFLIADLDKCLKKIAGKNAGAVVTFTGVVREQDNTEQSQLVALSLEHYPGMTENALIKIADDAKSKFSLLAVIIVHRVGKLKVGENIVYIGIASKHRKSAFESCDYIMDYLKNDAPFWKKEFRIDGSSRWLEQSQKDRDALNKW